MSRWGFEVIIIPNIKIVDSWVQEKNIREDDEGCEDELLSTMCVDHEFQVLTCVRKVCVVMGAKDCYLLLV